MNFLKTLFGTKESQIPEKTKVPVDLKPNIDIKSTVSESNPTTDKSKICDFKVELSSISRITGLDYEFINLIYFPNDQEKKKHCESIISTLSKLKIKSGADFHKVHEKLVDYNNIEFDEPLPFLIQSLMIEDFDIRKDFSGKTETKSTIITKGIEKIHSYYSAASFISENIGLKLNSQQSDFSFEENLFSSYVLKSDLNNFAKLNSIFLLGFAFFKANDIIKAEQYFELLEKGLFDLQPSTVSDFYRNIGELYIESDDKTKALKWLNAGLTLNPKLGVKKLVAKLKGDK